jgi:hypothetical protein
MYPTNTIKNAHRVPSTFVQNCNQKCLENTCGGNIHHNSDDKYKYKQQTASTYVNHCDSKLKQKYICRLSELLLSQFTLIERYPSSLSKTNNRHCMPPLHVFPPNVSHAAFRSPNFSNKQT